MSALRVVSSGVVGLIVLGVGAWSASVGFPLSAGIDPLGNLVSPEGVTRHLVCTGGVVGHVADSADIVAVRRGEVSIAGGEKSADLKLAARKNGSVYSLVGDDSTFAATESSSMKDPQIVGYLATECGNARNEQWLVGGSTETGRETTVILSNGADVDARVDIEVWGAKGLIDAPGSRGIIVPARTQRAYSVAGFAPDEPTPAIHVTSTGAAVWATLQMTAVRGLVPGGLDRIGSVDSPKSTLVFPLVRIPSEKSIGPVLADPQYSDVPATIRLLNPGDSDASITLTFDPAGRGEPTVVSTTVTAGVVTDIGFAELSPGDWSVTVDSDQPLVGAIRVGYRNAATRVTDVAWASAAPINSRSATLVAPVGATMGIVNPGETDTNVRVLIGGVLTEHDIVAGESISLAVTPGLVAIDSDDGVAASIFLQTSTGIATVRALSTPRDANDVMVIYG